MSDELKRYAEASKAAVKACSDFDTKRNAVAAIAAVLKDDMGRLLLPNPNAAPDLRRAQNDSAILKIEPEKWPTYAEIVESIRAVKAARQQRLSAFEAIPAEFRDMVKSPYDED